MHYVSQTGSNSIGTGTISNPWATVSYAAAHVLTAGHIIHILPGTIIESTAFTIASGVNLEGEGTVSIISSTYGSSYTMNLSGNQSVHDLKMDGNNITAYGAIQVSTARYVKIYNNTFINFSHFGVSFENGNTSSPPAVFAIGNEFHDNIVTNCSGYYGGNLGCLQIDGQDGILIYGNTMSADRGGANSGDVIYGVEGQLKNIEIYNNTLTKTYYPGVSSWDFAIELWNTLGGIHIHDNIIIGSIDIVGCQGVNGITADSTIITADDTINTADSSIYGVWIHNNTIGQVSLTNGEGAHGILFENGDGNTNYTKNVIVEKNIIRNVCVGVNFDEINPATLDDIRISYNLIYNIGMSGTDSKGWGIYFTDDQYANTINNFKVWNNVIIGATVHTAMWGIQIPDTGAATNVSIRNNIVENFTYAPVFAYDKNGAQTIDTLSIENNDFYLCGNSNAPKYNSITPTNNTTQNNLTANPLFISSSDFHLQVGSPAIGSGLDVDLTGTLDMGGVTITSPPEIGAYESTGIVVSPTPTRPITTLSPTSTPTRSRIVIALSPTLTSTITPTVTPTKTSTPSVTSSIIPASISPTPSKTPSRTPTITLSRTPTVTLTASQPLIPLSPSLTPSLTSSKTPSRTPSLTPTRSSISGPTPTPTKSSLVGSIYYVDGQNGSDSNNGSSGSPFKSVHYAAAHASSPSTIYINPGTVTETSQIVLPTGINITGAGVTSIINSTYSSDHTILLSSGTLNTNGNQKISNIRMIGNNSGTGSGGAYSAIGVVNRGNVTISNVQFDNFYYYAVYMLNGSDGSLPPATFATGNKIIDCTMNNCSAYIGVYSGGDSQGSINIGGQDGLVISGNTISVNRADGINGNCIDGVEGHFKNVKIYNNNLTKVFTPGYTWDFAIEFWNLYNGNEIYDNNIIGSVDICLAWGKSTSVGTGSYCVWIHDNTIGQDSIKYSADSVHGILLESTHVDVIIEKNFIRNTTETIFINLAYANASNDYYAPDGRFETINNHEDNLRISYNIIYNTGSLAANKGWGVYYSVEDPEPRQNTPIHNVQIVNNVFIGASGSMWGIQIPDAGQATNALIMNNIVKGFGYAPIFATGANGTSISTLNVTKNILFGNGNSNNVLLSNGFSPSLYTYDAPIKSDPLFISSTDFHLQGGSPAINAGTNIASPLLLPMTTDKDGITIGTPPEIGAYEYGVAPSPSPTRSGAVIVPSITPTPSRSLILASPSPTRSLAPPMSQTPTPSKSSIISSPTPTRTRPMISPSPTPSNLAGFTIVQGRSITCTDTGTGACYQYSTDVGGALPPNTFIFRNNYVSAVNTGGYVVQLGDDGNGDTNNWLQGELVSGNKIVWGGGTAAYGSSITHGVIVGYEINAVVKYNYINNTPYSIIYKSGDGTSAGNYLTNTSGGASYNIVRNGRFAARVKSLHGVKYCNNTFYTGDGQSWYMALISPDTDYALTVPTNNTKFFNNIFYSEASTSMIRIYDNCLTGFESDYNIFYCASGTPFFEIGNQTAGFTQYNFAQWQAMGYDTHSQIINPNFIDKVNFVPSARLNYGLNLNTKFGGIEFQTGLSSSAAWNLGVSPATQIQSGTWQVGAITLP
jgi:hypothetical protein